MSASAAAAAAAAVPAFSASREIIGGRQRCVAATRSVPSSLWFGATKKGWKGGRGNDDDDDDDEDNRGRRALSGADADASASGADSDESSVHPENGEREGKEDRGAAIRGRGGGASKQQLAKKAKRRGSVDRKKSANEGEHKEEGSPKLAKSRTTRNNKKNADEQKPRMMTKKRGRDDSDDEDSDGDDDKSDADPKGSDGGGKKKSPKGTSRRGGTKPKTATTTKSENGEREDDDDENSCSSSSSNSNNNNNNKSEHAKKGDKDNNNERSPSNKDDGSPTKDEAAAAVSAGGLRKSKRQRKAVTKFENDVSMMGFTPAYASITAAATFGMSAASVGAGPIVTASSNDVIVTTSSSGVPVLNRSSKLFDKVLEEGSDFYAKAHRSKRVPLAMYVLRLFQKKGGRFVERKLRGQARVVKDRQVLPFVLQALHGRSAKARQELRDATEIMRMARRRSWQEDEADSDSETSSLGLGPPTSKARASGVYDDPRPPPFVSGPSAPSKSAYPASFAAAAAAAAGLSAATPRKARSRLTHKPRRKYCREYATGKVVGELTDKDVLLGKGPRFTHYPGNMFFRDMVRKHR
jgi:hypothetical protein